MASLSRDVQINPLGTEDAPADFVLPAAMEIVPKSVFALFDGAAAAVAFLPTLEIISDAGRTVGRVPIGKPVAAGGSAAVSWFPGGEVGGGADIQGALAHLWLLSTDTPYTVAAGSTDQITFPNANWDPANLVADAGNGLIRVLHRSACWASASVLWEDADFPRSIQLVAPLNLFLSFHPSYGDFHALTPAGTFTTSNPTGLGPLWCRDTALFSPNGSGTFPEVIELDVHNGDVIDRNIVQAFFAVYSYFGANAA